MTEPIEIISRQGRKKKENLYECTLCHRFWPSTEFSVCKTVMSGLQPNCRTCLKKAGLKYRKTVEGKLTRKRRHDAWYSTNREKRLLGMKTYLQQLRRQVIRAYGSSCECCGESVIEFLCIDHRHGDGKVDRKNGLMGRVMYLHLIRNNYPRDKYRLLCHNCNMAHGLYGYCPHQKEQTQMEAI